MNFSKIFLEMKNEIFIFSILSTKTDPLLYLLTELSSQTYRRSLPVIRSGRRNLPFGYGIFYMTGSNNDIRRDITRETGPIQVVETESGKVIAVIDEDGYVRLMHRMDHYVQINICNRNHVQPLSPPEIVQNGLKYNVKWRSPRCKPTAREE